VSRWLRPIGLSTAAGALILAIYLVHPIAGGHRLPIGPDGPVYVWWTGYADLEGLGFLSGRSGVPAVALIFGSIFGTEPLQTVAFLGPVLATATGLAAAAVVETLLGPSLVRGWAAALLAGAWAGHLAAGYLGSLAMTALFLGAIGPFGLAERSWRGAIVGGGLLAGAALSHRPLLFLALAILAGAVVALAPEALRERRRGTPLLSTAVGRVTAGAGAGAAVGLGLGVVAGWGASRPEVDTSQDALLRRYGLEHLLRRQFRLRLAADARRAAVPMAAGATLGAAGIARTLPAMTTESKFLVAVCGSWAALSLAGVAILAATGGPANRLITFAFFFPLIAAIGVDALIRRRGARRAVGALAGLIMVAVSMFGWYRQEPFIEREEVEAVEAVAEIIDALPPRTPLVFLVDTELEAAAFHVARFANVIRSALPPRRITDVRLAVGRPEDYLSDRPTITGNSEHDRLSVSFLAESRTVDADQAVFVVRPFNQAGFKAATRVGTPVTPDIVALRGVPQIPGAGRTGPVRGSDPEPPGLGPTTLAAVSIGALALLALVGAGWARWGLPGAPIRAVVAAAPSVGLAGLILGAIAAQSVGVTPGGLGGIVAAVLVGASGYTAAALAGRDGEG
jgi:hypothetical protein